MGNGEKTTRGWLHKHRRLIWAAATLLLLMPPIVIELLDETRGDPGDFVFAAILLAGVLLALEAAVRTPDRRAYRVGLLIAVAAALILTWLNLAVGIVGSEDNPANLQFFGVLAIAAAGFVLAWFRPRGMALALVATAIAQLGVFFSLLLSGAGFTGPLTVFFVFLWLTAAALFWRAGRRGDGLSPSSDSV